MIHINKQAAKSNTIFIIILIITITGIISLIYSPNIEKQCETKWQTLQAQQASLNALSIAKDMLYSNFLNQECINTDRCPFWSAYPIIRLTNKNGLPNKAWWEQNAYPIQNSNNNAKFIIIKLQNHLYKIIAFAENTTNTQAIISSGYFKKTN